MDRKSLTKKVIGQMAVELALFAHHLVRFILRCFVKG